MRKHELARAIALAGSPSALARVLGVRPETVRRWVAKGITPGGTKLLAELRERLKLQEVEERGKRQTFDLLFKLAGERGDLRRGRTREGVRSGPRTSGYQWIWGVSQMLTDGLILEIDRWLQNRRRRFPYFQAVAVATEYTKQKFKGYKTVLHQVNNETDDLDAQEAAGDFTVEEQIATRRSASLVEVRQELAGKLEEAIEEGALVFIHEVTLFNYRLRTDPERAAWETGKRNARRKRAQRKSKRQASSKPKVEKETWPKKTTSKKSSKPSKKSKAKQATKATQATNAKATRTKGPVASRSRSASTRSQPTRSNSRRANAKPSQLKKSASRSRATTSKKSTKKPKSFSAPSKKKATSTTQAKMTKTTKTKTTMKTRHS